MKGSTPSSGSEPKEDQPTRRFSAPNPKKNDLVISSDSGSDSDSDSAKLRADSTWKPYEQMAIDTSYGEQPTGLAGFFRNLQAKLFSEEHNDSVPIHIEAMRSRVRVEPKTYFANERTLLQWLNLCIFLAIGAFALIKLSAPGAGWVGGSVLILSIVFSMYSLGVFHYRRHAIASTSIYGHYDDKIGPTILVLAIIIYLIGTLVFQLIIPTTLPTGVFPVTRDYRVTLDPAFVELANADLSNALQLLRTQLNTILTNTMEGVFTISGDEKALISSQYEEYFDSRSECTLNSNGFYLKQVTPNNPGTNIIYSTLERHTGDLMKAQELDSSYINHNATQIISPLAATSPTTPWRFTFEHYRERSLPIEARKHLTRLSDAANLFPTMLLWDSVKSSRWAEQLVSVNNVDLRLSVYGDSQLSFDSYHKGKVRTLIWELVPLGQPAQVIHAQLSVTYPTTNVGSMSQSEITNMNDLFRAISVGLIYRSPVEKMIEQYVYEFSSFCA